MMDTGYIYKITCTVNGKLYIGQTVQKLSKRLYAHIYEANTKNIDCAFHNAIKKHGGDCFIIELIVEVTGKDRRDLKTQLDELEKEYINKFDSYLKGYNSTLGGYGTLGSKLSEDHKRKIYRKGWHHSDRTKAIISKKSKGRHHSEETIAKIKEARKRQVLDDTYYRKLRESAKKFRKKVAQYDFDGNLIGVYDSLTSASEQTGLSDSTIGMVCNGKRQSGGGYYWLYVDGHVIDNVAIQVDKDKIDATKPKRVIQLTKDNEVVREFDSISDASKKTDVVLSSIVENCKGKRKSAGGFVWKYV